MRTSRCAILLASFLAVALLPAQAASVSDQLTVYTPSSSILYQLTVYDDGTFTGGDCALASPGNPCTGGEGFPNFFYLTDTSIVDTARVGDLTGLLTEDGSHVSDILGVGSSSFPVFGFYSDDSGAMDAFAPQLTRTFVEDGDPIDVSLYLTPDLQSQGYTMTILSLDASVATPEPATCVLLAPALLVLLRRRAAARRTE